MRLVIVESPYSGDVDRNIAYARAALKDCLERGEAPYASHLLYAQPGVLDDTKPHERTRGMEAGRAWMILADVVAVYEDLGISEGMKWGIRNARRAGLTIEHRSLPEFAPQVQPSTVAAPQPVPDEAEERNQAFLESLEEVIDASVGPLIRARAIRSRIHDYAEASSIAATLARQVTEEMDADTIISIAEKCVEVNRE